MDDPRVHQVATQRGSPFFGSSNKDETSGESDRHRRSVLRSEDVKALQDWYLDNLGLEPDADGYVILNWGGDHSGSTVWSAFDGDAGYFGGPEAQWMIKYRVDDLDGLIEKLKAAGVQVADKRFEDVNGRFAHL